MYNCAIKYIKENLDLDEIFKEDNEEKENKDVNKRKKINKKTNKPDAFKLQLWDARYLEIKSLLKMARE